MGIFWGWVLGGLLGGLGVLVAMSVLRALLRALLGVVGVGVGGSTVVAIVLFTPNNFRRSIPMAPVLPGFR